MEVQYIEVIDLRSDSEEEVEVLDLCSDSEEDEEVEIPMFEEPVIGAALYWGNQDDRWGIIQQCWGALYSQHAGLEGWRLVPNTRCVRRAGCARFDTREVEISTLYLRETNETEALDTVRHEAAHCLAGYSAGHGPEWKRVAEEIGCTAERCHGVQFAKHKAKAFGVCGDNCEHRNSRMYFKMTRRLRETIEGRREMHCVKCKTALKIIMQ